MSDQHPAITHWRDIESEKAWSYDGDTEPMGLNAPFGQHFGLQRIGIHHVRLQPGRRTSYPHAESGEDEFVYVLEGTPDVWLDGHLHRLQPGDGVGFPAGTGLAHSFLNNSEAEVCLLVVGDKWNDANRIFYAVNPEQRARREDWWHDVPARPMGPHDGLTDAGRAAKKR